ncbi:MAG TPA: hypothetical protein VK879_21060, partial [Candidatus Sulfomarinibacteraceae bacterium]|nr:hypothetical protein [Candidatus Sulfomarinibacteraceae bacterium]
MAPTRKVLTITIFLLTSLLAAHTSLSAGKSATSDAASVPLRLATGVFDPLFESPPPTGPLFVERGGSPSANYIVQFHGP